MTKRKRSGIRILKATPWLDLLEMRYPAKGIKSYIYSREKRCDGRIVAIMPWRRSNGKIFYLLRRELTPPWDTDNLKVSSITGGIERGKTPEEMALLELWEEAGYHGTTEGDFYRWKTLGAVYGTKSSDTVYSLFAVNVSGLKPKQAPGDGSELEDKARNIWVTDALIGTAVDPLVYTLHYKTKRMIDKTTGLYPRRRNRQSRLNNVMRKLGIKTGGK